MKVKLKSIESKPWNNKNLYIVVVEGENHDRVCFDGSISDWKAGEEYDAILTEKEKDGKKQYYIKKDQPQKQSGYNGKSPEEQLQIIKMNVNTASVQIVCAMLNQKLITDPTEVPTAWKMMYQTGLNIVTGANH